MIIVLQLIAIGVFALVGVTLWKSLRTPKIGGSQGDGPVIDGVAEESLNLSATAAEALRHYDNVRNALKQKYPAVFAMLGGYLNAHTIADHGGVESAVRQMMVDWRARHEEVARELAALLAEIDGEDEARAVVLAACDADFDQEGYKSWLSWLLSQFNRVG